MKIGKNLKETLNKSILAPLRHGFSRRGIDGYAFIQRILKKIRMRKGLSQLNVAESVGVTKGTISLYESDGRTPTLFVAKKNSRCSRLQAG